MTKICYFTHMNLNVKTSSTVHIEELVEHMSKQSDIYLIDANYYNKHNFNFKIKKKKYPYYINRYTSFIGKSLSLFFSKLRFGPESESGLLFNSFDINKLFRVLYVCKKNKIDIVICSNPNNIPFVKLACKLLGIKLIFEEFNVEFMRIKKIYGESRFSRWLKKFELWCCRGSDLIFTVSEVDRKTLIDFKIRPEKIVTISNSANLNKFEGISKSSVLNLKDEYNIGNKKVIMMHGDWSYKPNKVAFELFKKKIHPALYEIYGDKVLCFVLGKNIPEFSFSNVVKLGWVDNLAMHLSLADLAIVPLLSGGGTRNKILDYLALGIPVVSTYIGSEGIELKNGQDALLSKTVDSDFINKICHLIDNPLESRTIGNSGREICLKNYSWHENSKKAINACNQLI